MWKKATGSLLGILLMTACGARPSNSTPSTFINHTRHSDAQLQALWSAAQQTLSQQIDMNPLQRELYNSSPNIVPGDSRVWGVSPQQLAVSSQADVSSPTLLASTGMIRPDPTGLIACPQPCNVNYAPAYSLFAKPATRYAASWESSDRNFNALVQYEFENQILHALGYDTTWRWMRRNVFLETRVHQGFPTIYTNGIHDAGGVTSSRLCRELRNSSGFYDAARPSAQSALHTPVNELHSIQNKQLTNSFFPLTKKLQGVKHNCSLTVSEVFPVGAASGGQAKSP
jgi:hypothetical protein